MNVFPAPRATWIALAALLTPPALLPPALLAVSAFGVRLERPVCLALAAIVVMLGIGLAAWIARDGASRTHPEPGPRPDPAPRLARVLLALFALAALAFCGFAWVSQLRIAAERPVIDWDGLYYHVPTMHAWARAGRIVWIESIPDIRFVNGYPMALEALGLWSVQVFGHDRWVDAANLLLWPVGALGLAAFAQLLGARGSWSVLAGAAVAFIPTVVISSATAYVDAGFFCVNAALLALTLERLRARTGVAGAVLWGVGLGAVMGIKGTGIPLAAILLATVLVHASGAQGARRKQALREWVLAASIAVLVGGGWPLRAMVHTGNPLHPVELRLGNKVLAEGTDHRAAVDLSMEPGLRALPSPLRGPATWLRPFTPITRYDQTEGLGPLWTFAGWPAVCLALVFALRRRDATLLHLAGACALWWTLQPAPWWARFSPWLLALGWPAAVALCAQWWRSPGSRATAVRAMALGLPVLVLALSAGVCNDVLARERSWREAHRSAEATASDAVGARWPALAQRPEFAPALAAPRIGRSRVIRLGSLLAGALAQPIGMRELVVVDTEPLEQLADRMRALDLTWLWWDEATAGPVTATLPPGLRLIDRYDLGGSDVVLLRCE